MELYDIIEAANSHLKEGTLILHRSMKAHPMFKVYKIFCYNLYYVKDKEKTLLSCLLYTSPSPRDRTRSRMPSSA